VVSFAKALNNEEVVLEQKTPKKPPWSEHFKSFMTEDITTYIKLKREFKAK
jgi:hypothetical protein